MFTDRTDSFHNPTNEIIHWLLLKSYQWNKTLVTTVPASRRFINVGHDL
ncbi:hypothetical protein SLEP1_g22646 [Rubroshorea leprosula]|uniref:Uncharacterized protein n=1 Tax=Rubroshorea leprosula TaxID=152421 RepID=A0AAV5JFW1_9ROSI|nr:hypothetical protein SLEP1_g22646 [Rubroshorea leprosula]